MKEHMTYVQSLNVQNFPLGCFEGEGEYDIPIIKPEFEYYDCPFCGFDKRYIESDTHGAHFFYDDSKTLRVWNSPKRYINALSKFRYILAPTFSMHPDYPAALSVYNQYRRHWCARYWQTNGFIVFPTISWMRKDSYDWCFDGEPYKAIVAVSSDCVKNGILTRKEFIDGYEEMEKRLKPSKVFWFGNFCLDKERENIVMCKLLPERERALNDK